MKLARFFFTTAFIGLSGLAFTSAASAEDLVTKTVSLDRVRSIVLEDGFDLNLTQGDEEYVKITAPRNALPKVIAEVHGDTLRIQRKRGNWSMSIFAFEANARFDVQLKEIRSLELMGSGHITVGKLDVDDFTIEKMGSGQVEIKSLDASDFDLEVAGSAELSIGDIHADRVDVEIAGSPNIDLGDVVSEELVSFEIAGSGDVSLDSLHANKLAVEIAGSGVLEIAGAGFVDAQYIEIAGSGDYKAPKLESETAEIEVAGSSNLEVFVTKELNVEAMGSVDVLYHGDPEVEYDVGGHSNIHQAK